MCSELAPRSMTAAAEPGPPLRTMDAPATSPRTSRTVDLFERARSSRLMTVRELAISLLGVSTRVAVTTTSWRRSGGGALSSFSKGRGGGEGRGQEESEGVAEHDDSFRRPRTRPGSSPGMQKKIDPVFLPKTGSPGDLKKVS